MSERKAGKAPGLWRRLALLGGVLLGLGFAQAPPLEAAPKPTASLTITIRPKDNYPPAPVTDLTATAGAEGQMLLEWTAPDSDNNVFATKTSVFAYTIRVATYSAQSVGSTTTWWNNAQSVSAPSPGQPGQRDSLLLNTLDPGTTYYAALRSVDSNGFSSELDTKTVSLANQASALVFDAKPAAPTNLTASLLAGKDVQLSWTAPSAFDLDFYRVYVDSAAPYDFADRYFIVVDSASASYTHQNLKNRTSYYYYVTAVDKGEPAYPGSALESAASTGTNILVKVSSGMRPIPPIGFKLEVSTLGVELRWLPVAALEDGTTFVSPDYPATDELSAYRVYRASAPVAVTWQQLVALSTASRNWTDATSDPYYYHLRSENDYGLSDPSMILSNASKAAIIIAPDERSLLEIPEGLLAKLNGDGASCPYWIKASSQPEDLGGRVFKSLKFAARRCGTDEVTNLDLGGLSKIKLRYEKQGGSLSPSAASVAATPDQMSVYWHNGAKWVQLYGKADTANQVMSVETQYTGRYQLRSVERTGGFNFDTAGLSNRLLTPNGDGKNDYVVFTFDNPRDAQVSGKIYDMKGAEVASLAAGPTSTSLMWDGKSGGAAVPGGVYIYQIEAEGRTFNGTIVVIK